jgi:hypothetical protein
MLTTNELKVTLDILRNGSEPPTEADADWLRGAIDIVNLLIKKSQE